MHYHLVGTGLESLAERGREGPNEPRRIVAHKRKQADEEGGIWTVMANGIAEFEPNAEKVEEERLFKFC